MGKTLDAWAALLDRSFEQIAEISADTRNFDRAAYGRLGSIWDNNTYAFFHAASARVSWRREALARRHISLMNECEPDRYQWAAEQAGRDLSLPEPTSDAPAPRELTAEVVEELELGYDLRDATVCGFCVEQSRGRLKGEVRIDVQRRQHGNVLLTLQLDDVHTARFDLADSRGIRFDHDGNEFVLSIGAQGVVRADRGFERAGRAPNHRPWPRARGGWLRGAAGRLPTSAEQAAAILQNAMLVLRSAGSLQNLGATPTYELSQTFANAGSDILSAGTSFRREPAFRRLIEQWRSAGGDLLAELLDGSTSARFNPKLPNPTGPVDPASQLLLAEYSTSFLSHYFHPTSPPTTTATLVLGSPDHGALRRIHVDEPQQFAVRTEVFGTTFGAAQQGGLLAMG